MPHTFTQAERDAIAAGDLKCYGMFEAQDPDLAWVNFSLDLSDDDWFNAVTLHDDIDANAMDMSASLLRDTNGLSLAPLLESSTLNRNAADEYAPMLDLVRMWRVSVCVIPHADPAPTWPDDYHEIGKGYLDTIQVNDSNDASISVEGRGEEAIILDTEILEELTYSIGTADDMETVIQALLDDNLDDPPTLYVPVATSYIINEYAQPKGNLMMAIQTVAGLIGAVVRYRYDSSGDNRLTLFIPPREAEEGDEDWEITPEEYLRLPLNRLAIMGVRNYIPVTFFNSATGVIDDVLYPLTGTSGSITTFKRRAMPIDLSEDTQLTTEDRVQAFADAVGMDLEYPKLEQQFETFGFWPVQLCDYGKMLPNGVHY